MEIKMGKKLKGKRVAMEGRQWDVTWKWLWTFFLLKFQQKNETTNHFTLFGFT